MNTSEHANQEIVEVASHEEPNILNPEAQMVGLTWITFFLLLAVLYKFAWKPILAALDAREDMIRKSVEHAEKAKQELDRINQTRADLIKEAEVKAKDIIDQSRKAAVEAAHIVHEKAKEESKILLENAVRDIKEEKEKAKAELKEVSAQIAVDLAEKLIEEHLDDEKSRRIINKMIKEV